MNQLAFEFKNLCHRCREGSYSTQTSRRFLLAQIADDLNGLGFKNLQMQSLKPKHILALNGKWQKEALSDKTKANRMTALRWVAGKINKLCIIAEDNSQYGIERRSDVATISKAEELTPEILDKIGDPLLKLSVQLQKHFGLRREESIKFNADYADHGDYIELKGSWTKGGRPREIPIITAEQRELLNKIKQAVGKNSLIPADKKYKHQLRTFTDQTREAGIGHSHGLRHTYAQARYNALTGWDAPCCGGPSFKQLTSVQRAKDLEARQTIAMELGHNRVRITYAYLGR